MAAQTQEDPLVQKQAVRNGFDRKLNRHDEAHLHPKPCPAPAPCSRQRRLCPCSPESRGSLSDRESNVGLLRDCRTGEFFSSFPLLRCVTGPSEQLPQLPPAIFDIIEPIVSDPYLPIGLSCSQMTNTTSCASKEVCCTQTLIVSPSCVFVIHLLID